MADGFIVRKGGVTTEQALAPTITEVSTTDSSITFTITNNDASTAVILYELDDATPDANSIELATGATSSNITASGLAFETAFNVYATANVTGKVKSNVTELEISTDQAPVYTAATGGTTLEYDDGGKRYKSHTFTTDGTFTVTTVGNGDRDKADYLIIAGGGGGGGTFGGGGGGAGGFRTTVGTQGGNGILDPKVVLTTQAYSINVGAGGTGGFSGGNAVNSFALSITSIGGGGGGGASDGTKTGKDGGSGGGGGRTSQPGIGGLGISGQGNNGGNGLSGSPAESGGGGGGADFAGGNAGNTFGGFGGNGLANTLRTGSNETRAGGGGGGSHQGTGGIGGTGGGGNGRSSGDSGTAATVNTGSGGGGGGSNNNGLNGARGIVIIRYEIATV